MVVDTKHGGYAKSVDMSGKQQSVQDVQEEVALNVQGKRGKITETMLTFAGKFVDMFPQTDDFWICFRKQRKCSKSVDMFPYTDDINLIATRHVETVVLLSKLHVDHYVNITIDTKDLELTSAESKAAKLS